MVQSTAYTPPRVISVCCTVDSRKDSPVTQPIQYQAIGILHTPFDDIRDMPIQPTGAQGVRGTAEVFDAFCAGLIDLDGFSHIILLYHLHQVEEPQLVVTPFLDTRSHGVFATRAPRRPNPIGLSVVRLVRLEGNVLHLENVDMLDGTPLLDIKPYIPAFDHQPVTRLGWLEGASDDVHHTRSDDRFR